VLPLNATAKYPATNKERFDQCIAMLKAYYDALEDRLAKTVAWYVLIVGWLITSKDTRNSLATNKALLVLAIASLLIMTGAYSLNIRRWVSRWRQIRGYLDELGYVEPRFYARFDLPDWTVLVYMSPVVLLCAFIIAFLILAARGATP